MISLFDHGHNQNQTSRQTSDALGGGAGKHERAYASFTDHPADMTLCVASRASRARHAPATHSSSMGTGTASGTAAISSRSALSTPSPIPFHPASVLSSSPPRSASLSALS